MSISAGKPISHPQSKNTEMFELNWSWDSRDWNQNRGHTTDKENRDSTGSYTHRYAHTIGH